MFPHHQLFATDIRSQTLVCAKKNFVRQKVKCNLILSNLFEKINAKYDLIFANLPYISSNFPLDSEVKNQDPQIALYGGVDGLK
ncbi:MAG: methyltransferase [Mollicutes bacterium]|nr:MAG: methyltransferase [Mollicutes bacterium]